MEESRRRRESSIQGMHGRAIDKIGQSPRLVASISRFRGNWNRGSFATSFVGENAFPLGWTNTWNAWTLFVLARKFIVPRSILTGDSPTSDMPEDLLDLIRAGRGFVSRIVCEREDRLWRSRDTLLRSRFWAGTGDILFFRSQTLLELRVYI